MRTDAGVSAITPRNVRLLPLPDSPTMPSERPASTAKDTPSTTRQRRVAIADREREVAHLQRGRRHCGRSRSASPSPTSDRLRPTRTTAMPGNVASVHFVVRNSWPSLIIVPHSGVGGWMPSPR